MAKFHIAGRMTIVGDDDATGHPGCTIHESELPGMQGRVVVAALVLERRPVSRDVLAEWLWPDGPAVGYAKSLNPLLSRVRAQLQRLDPPGAPGKFTLRAGSGSVEIVIPGDSWIDVEDAITRIDRAEGAMRAGNADDAWADATVGVSILRHGLLPGCSGPWVERMREDLTDRLYRAWSVLGEVWLIKGDVALARTTARSAIELDRYREEAHRLLIRAELAGENRALAARAAAACRTALSELGVLPSAATEDLERQIFM